MASDQKHILIVEDEKALSHALDVKLRGEGFNVTIAEDGEEALREIKGGQFDLVLLDIIMPRMDGFTLLEMFKEAGSRWKTVPVLVLSNLGQKEEVDRAMELGATDFLVKANSPFPKIIKTINSILKKK